MFRNSEPADNTVLGCAAMVLVRSKSYLWSKSVFLVTASSESSKVIRCCDRTGSLLSQRLFDVVSSHDRSLYLSLRYLRLVFLFWYSLAIGGIGVSILGIMLLLRIDGMEIDVVVRCSCVGGKVYRSRVI